LKKISKKKKKNQKKKEKKINKKSSSEKKKISNFNPIKNVGKLFILLYLSPPPTFFAEFFFKSCA